MHGEENFNGVVTVTQIVFAHIYGFFFDDLLLAALCGAVRSEAPLVRVTCISSFLEKRLVSVGRSGFLLNDKVRCPVLILAALLRIASRTHRLSLFLAMGPQLIRILTNVLEKFSPAEVILGPFGDVVVGFFLLEPLKDDLVLSGYLHELTFAGLAIETFLEGE